MRESERTRTETPVPDDDKLLPFTTPLQSAGHWFTPCSATRRPPHQPIGRINGSLLSDQP